MKQAIISIAALFLFTSSFGQSTLSTDTSVIVLPHWKKDEMHTVLFKSATNDLSHGETKKYLSTFNTTFLITDKDTSGYTIEWTYTKATLAPGEVTLENILLAHLLNTKLIVKLSLIGKFKGLLNVDEVQSTANNAIDKLISGSGNNPDLNLQYKFCRQMVSTKQGLEIALLKQIKMYNLSFGYNYKTNFIQTNNLKISNPFGGLPFNAIEKVQLIKLDKLNNICVIETSQNVDGMALRDEVIDYLKKIAKKDGRDYHDEMENKKVEFSESSVQQIDFSKGIVQKSTFGRIANFAFQNRATVVEIETLN